MPEGVSVKLGSRVISTDLSTGYVQLSTGLFVKEAFANVAKQEFVEPIGKGRRFVSKARLSPKVAYDVALAVRFIGTSGQLVQSTTVNGQEVVEYFQYVRPTAGYAPSLLAVINVIKELEKRGLPWRAIVIAYPPGRRARVLYVRGIKAFLGKYRTKSGVKQYPQIFLYFNQHIIGGLKKRKPYTFDLLVLYTTKPAKPAKVKQWKEELAEAEARARSTPPPSIAVAPATKAPVRAVTKAEPQPTAVAPPQVEVVPQQPSAQALAPQPATVGSGNYVKPAEEGGETSRHYVKPAEEVEQELNEIHQNLADIDSGNTEETIKKLRESAKRLNL